MVMKRPSATKPLTNLDDDDGVNVATLRDAVKSRKFALLYDMNQLAPEVKKAFDEATYAINPGRFHNQESKTSSGICSYTIQLYTCILISGAAFEDGRWTSAGDRDHQLVHHSQRWRISDQSSTPRADADRLAQQDSFQRKLGRWDDLRGRSEEMWGKAGLSYLFENCSNRFAI